MNNRRNSGRNKFLWTAIMVLCMAGCIGCLIWVFFAVKGNREDEEQLEALKDSFVHELSQESQSEPEQSSEPEPTVPAEPESTVETEPPVELDPGEVMGDFADYDVPNRVIDFEDLWKQCKDVYAWLYVPGTTIDYPIVQHPTDVNYYLRRALDGSSKTAGTIFTQNYNSKDWSDHNTVIYGHNMRNGSMFASLHNFEDKDFFAENRYIYIYTPEDVKVYEVFAAYEYSDVHLLVTFDTTTDEGFADYLANEVFNREGGKAQYHDDVAVTEKSRIITLSTCVNGGRPTIRYLVQARLVAEGTLESGETGSAEEANRGESSTS